ncbi:MAG: hypothetical protein HYX86_02425 [Chloroflexi bacterium]|nr:hypothetical protein [Chloroflexota bacterium]
MSGPNREKTYALGFLLAFGLGAVGACLAGVALILFLTTPLSSSLHPPTPTLLFPTPLVTVSGPASTPLPPTPTALSIPPSPTPEDNPIVTPTPTGYEFSVLRISEPPPCEQRRLIRGRVFDAQGQGLGDVQVRLFNDFGYSAIFYTWVDSPAGYYEFFMGTQPGEFHMQILGADDQPASPVADLHYEGGCISEMDWQRSF